MPGHIGTSIVTNSRKIQSGNESDATERRRKSPRCARACASMGIDVDEPMSDDDIAEDRATSARGASSRTRRPRAAEAAKIILDGVKADRWRILVGDDAHKLDERVRQSPERAYDVDFFESFAEEVGWRLG